MGGFLFSVVACGSYHTAFVGVDGSLWTCGTASEGQLGRPCKVQEDPIAEHEREDQSKRLKMNRSGAKIGRVQIDEHVIFPLILNHILTCKLVC